MRTKSAAGAYRQAHRATEVVARSGERRLSLPSNELRLYDGTVEDLVHRRRRNDGPRLIVTPNLDHWRLLWRSKTFRRAYLSASVVLNDSRFLMRTLLGRGTMTIPGSELALLILEAAPPRSRLTVIGCTPSVKQYLHAARPDLDIDLVEPSQGVILKRAERRAIVRRTMQFGAERIFVCIGAPQSEVLAHQMTRTLRHKCDILCCGSGLQFASGQKARAPRWMRSVGLEWLWRMIHEKHTRARYLVDALFLLRRHRTLAALARDRRVSIRPLHPSPL